LARCAQVMVGEKTAPPLTKQEAQRVRI
jgi:hypothetical protein